MEWCTFSPCQVWSLARFSVLLTCVLCGHARLTCEGGRSEGDKWFDGCRWCVCQTNGPLCSPASCSDLVSQVSPCQQVGSSWKDGCYHCTCHLSGIECIADPACIVLMQTDDFLSCVEPEDDRCVCGVDGTPSCTAEVIDRNAHPATTIALDTSSYSPTRRYGQDDPERYGFRHHVADGWARRRVKRKSSLDDYLKRREHRRRIYRLKSGVRSSYSKPYRFFNRLGGYYNYADSDEGYPNRGYHSGYENEDRKRKQISKGDTSSMLGDVPPREEDGRVMQDDGRDLTPPRSLLIITKNRCRYGARWYGGGLRCYCDEDGSITCGDPKFVSTRIDGFRLEKDVCEEGHAWYDEGKCQVCVCKFSGVVLCRRSESCPLPFLIQPVEQLPSSENPGSNKAMGEHSGVISASTSGKTVDRRSGSKPYSRFSWERHRAKSAPRPDDSDDEKTIELPFDSSGKPAVILDREKDGRYYHGKHHRSNHKKHTTVIVTECNPGSRWLDGCKRCSCNSLGRRNCDESRCLKPAIPPFRTSGISGSSESISDSRRRPFQRPPAIPIIRHKPVEIKSPFPLKNPCGKYKVGERYWIKCNRCLCTPHGPKCTAINCG